MTNDVRRRLDGSIDIEFYRDQGLAERRAEMKAMLKGIVRFVRAALPQGGHPQAAPSPAL